MCVAEHVPCQRDVHTLRLLISLRLLEHFGLKLKLPERTFRVANAILIADDACVVVGADRSLTHAGSDLATHKPCLSPKKVWEPEVDVHGAVGPRRHLEALSQTVRPLRRGSPRPRRAGIHPRVKTPRISFRNRRRRRAVGAPASCAW